ncbi:MAG: ribonuclease Z [Edaphocola sp.]
MNIRLTILGNNSALPANGRHPTAQIIEIRDQIFLVDCGESTQIQMQRYDIRRRRINHVFISHLHGDHYFGLIGLLTSAGLMGRTAPLEVYGPPMLEEIIDIQLRAANIGMPYRLTFHHIQPGDAKVLVDAAHYSVSCFPTEHRIPCHGFKFTAKGSGRKIIPEKCREYEISSSFYNRLKAGEDYLGRDGELVKNEWVTAPGPVDKTYAYCSDSRYTHSFIDAIKGADVVYHESTYLEEDRLKAYERYHSTALQAANLAKAAGAKRLLLGHFSSKYTETEGFAEEARTVFPDTEATVEGTTYEW